jgi:hypothetical protein
MGKTCLIILSLLIFIANVSAGEINCKTKLGGEVNTTVKVTTGEGLKLEMTGNGKVDVATNPAQLRFMSEDKLVYLSDTPNGIVFAMIFDFEESKVELAIIPPVLKVDSIEYELNSSKQIDLRKITSLDILNLDVIRETSLLCK